MALRCRINRSAEQSNVKRKTTVIIIDDRSMTKENIVNDRIKQLMAD